MTTPDTNDTTKGASEAVTVARGHSIRHGGKTYSAGQSVTLPAADVERLRARGFIARPNEAAPTVEDDEARTQGPTFETKAGPSVSVKRRR